MINWVVKKLNDSYKRSLEREIKEEETLRKEEERKKATDEIFKLAEKTFSNDMHASPQLPKTGAQMDTTIGVILPVNDKMETSSDIYKKSIGKSSMVMGMAGTSGLIGSTGVSGTSGYHGTAGASISKKIVSGIDPYVEYIANTLNDSIKYSEYIADNMEKSIRYSEYIAEKFEAPSYRDWMNEYAGMHSPKNITSLRPKNITWGSKNEVKRIYSPEDPYGEENWEE